MSTPIAVNISPSSSNVPRGVMAADYARDRTRKPHLAFRFKCRAAIAARMFRTFAASPTPPSIVDFGAADGRAMLETHRLLGAVSSIGIEWANELIGGAPEMPRGCRLVQGDVTKSHPLVPPGAFDLVTALAVFEHIERPAELASRARDSLKPGGLLIATCPSGVWDRVSGAIGLHKSEHHETEFNRRRFETLMREAGFEPVAYERFMSAPIGVLPYARVPVSTDLALAIDRVLARIPVVNLMMVNQIFVARKPVSGPVRG